MTAQSVTCPLQSVLSDFGLGNLDPATAESVSKHLETCAECRDIYSLGVVFYEALTGRRPYRRTERRELLEEISSGDIRPPRQLDHTIPRKLESICLKALGHRPADRYTTALDMAEDLRRWQSGGETTGSESEKSPIAPMCGDGRVIVTNQTVRSRKFKVLIGCGELLTLSITATKGPFTMPC